MPYILQTSVYQAAAWVRISFWRAARGLRIFQVAIDKRGRNQKTFLVISSSTRLLLSAL